MNPEFDIYAWTQLTNICNNINLRVRLSKCTNKYFVWHEGSLCLLALEYNYKGTLVIQLLSLPQLKTLNEAKIQSIFLGSVLLNHNVILLTKEGLKLFNINAFKVTKQTTLTLTSYASIKTFDQAGLFMIFDFVRYQYSMTFYDKELRPIYKAKTIPKTSAYSTSDNGRVSWIQDDCEIYTVDAVTRTQTKFSLSADIQSIEKVEEIEQSRYLVQFKKAKPKFAILQKIKGVKAHPILGIKKWLEIEQYGAHKQSIKVGNYKMLIDGPKMAIMYFPTMQMIIGWHEWDGSNGEYWAQLVGEAVLVVKDSGEYKLFQMRQMYYLVHLLKNSQLFQLKSEQIDQVLCMIDHEFRAP